MKSTVNADLADARHQAQTDKLMGPGHFFFPCKTTLSISSYREAEVFSIQQLLDYMRDWSTRLHEKFVPVAIQGKYDGVSCFLHRDKEGNFFAFTEDGSEISKRVPFLIDLAKNQLPETDWIILGELEKWVSRGGKRVHQGREYISGELHRDGDALDKSYTWNIYDLLWYNGEDIHAQTYQVRFSKLSDEFKIKQSVLKSPSPGFNLTPTTTCLNADQLTKVIKALDRIPSLEGAMIKRWDGFKYSLNGRTTEELKFKKYAECHLWVTDKRLIRGSTKTYQYKVAVEVLTSELDEVNVSKVIDFEGKKAMVIAKTFNTNVEAEVGDVVTIVFHNLFATRDEEGKLTLTLYEPRVYENRTLANKGEHPDTITTLLKIGTDSELLSYKYLKPADDTIPFELVKQLNVFMQYPSEDEQHEFIIHNHWRGSTVHGDLRIQSVRNQFLLGYTLNIQVKGEAPEVTTVEEAKRQVDNTGLWKFNAHTGDFMSRQTRAGTKKATSIVVELKEPEPVEWMTFEGVAQSGDVGSTQNYPGVFVIAAKGQAEYGFRTGYFHEYWLHCSSWKNGGQRLVFRQLASDFDKGISIPEFLKWAFNVDEAPEEFIYENGSLICSLGEVPLPDNLSFDFENIIKADLPPSDPQDIRTPTMWMMVKPNDDIPYVLSPRAVKKGRIPPYGISALPRSLRLRIPKEYQYWTMREPDQAKAVRDNLVGAIKRRDVKLDLASIYKNTEVFSLKDGIEYSFVLNKRTWRGPIVIRVGYSAIIYDLWIAQDNHALLFSFSSDPREGEATGTMQKLNDKALMSLVGPQPPKSPLNPNLKIPVNIERLQEGKLQLYDNTESVKKFSVNSDGWKGMFLISQDDNSNIWSLEPTASIGDKEMKPDPTDDM